MNTQALPRLRDEAIVRPFDDGGTKPRFVIAVDGCHFVVTPAVAALLDETRSLLPGDASEALAQRVSQRTGVSFTPQEVETLLRERVPKSFFEPATGVNGEQSPLMLSRLLVSGARLQPLLALGARLFAVRTALCAGLIALTLEALAIWHFRAQGATAMGAGDYVLSFALTLAGIFVHELGHLAACHRFGGRHGGIGVGIYWCFPAFYAEVHGAWTLPRWHRAAVDVGGVYLQFLFVGLLAAAYLATHSPTVISAIVLSHLLMLHTLNPVLKFDGYWLLCDLAGIHNLHQRVRDAARRLLKRSPAQRPAGKELALLAAFAGIALAYFTYLLAVLGHNLGLAVASFLAAAVVAGPSTAALLSALGKGLLLAFLLVLAFGLAMLLAQAGQSLLTEKSNER